MTIIEISALANGAHRNQSGTFNFIPNGWAVIGKEVTIPDSFPFVDIEVENGVVTAMTSREVPVDPPRDEPMEIDELTKLQLAVAELAQVTEENNTANQLAIAELAEAILGG